MKIISTNFIIFKTTLFMITFILQPHKIWLNNVKADNVENEFITVSDQVFERHIQSSRLASLSAVFVWQPTDNFKDSMNWINSSSTLCSAKHIQIESDKLFVGYISGSKKVNIKKFILL